MNSETYHPPADPAKAPSLLSRILAWIAFLIVVLFLAAIVIPTTSSSRLHEPAFRSLDSQHLRQIGQASLIYSSDNQEQLPQVDDIYAFARDLARSGGLNDATIWVPSQSRDTTEYAKLSTVLSSDRQTLHPAFAAIRPNYAAAVRGLRANDSSTTPIAWTRGLQLDGTWSADSPYGGDGGHIVFLGGNVAWFRKAELIDRKGNPTTDIRAALPPDAVIANN